MNRLVVGIGVALLLVFNVTKARATIREATITGTASAPATGACTVPGYGSQCRSGSCICIQIPNATVAKVPGQFGLGIGTANLFLTFDEGAEMPTGVGNCIPFFGIAQLSTRAFNETLDLVGVNCDVLSGQVNQHVLGGFGIAQTPAPNPLSTGFGQIRGRFNRSTTGALALTLDGAITP